MLYLVITERLKFSSIVFICCNKIRLIGYSDSGTHWKDSMGGKQYGFRGIMGSYVT